LHTSKLIARTLCCRVPSSWHKTKISRCYEDATWKTVPWNVSLLALAMALALCVCVSVCVPHKPILYRSYCTDFADFFCHTGFSRLILHCVLGEIWLFLKTRAHPSRIRSQTLDIQKFHDGTSTIVSVFNSRLTIVVCSLHRATAYLQYFCFTLFALKT